MDAKVYTKEVVMQPQGETSFLRTDVIDFYPVFSDKGELELSNIELLEDKEETEQALALATIYQKGQDPVDPIDGTDWGGLLLGDVSALQIITQLQAAVKDVSDTASIAFTTVRDIKGNERLAFELRAV